MLRHHVRGLGEAPPLPFEDYTFVVGDCLDIIARNKAKLAKLVPGYRATPGDCLDDATYAAAATYRSTRGVDDLTASIANEKGALTGYLEQRMDQELAARGGGAGWLLLLAAAALSLR